MAVGPAAVQPPRSPGGGATPAAAAGNFRVGSGALAGGRPWYRQGDVVGNLDVGDRLVAGVGDVVRPGHGAADGDERPGAGVVVRAVGQLHQRDARLRPEVVVGVVGVDGGAGDGAGPGHRSDVAV